MVVKEMLSLGGPTLKKPNLQVLALQLNTNWIRGIANNADLQLWTKLEVDGPNLKTIHLK